MPGRPLENEAAHMDLLDQLDRLQRENDELKAEISAIRGGAAEPEGTGRPLFISPTPSPVAQADQQSQADQPTAAPPGPSPITPAPEAPDASVADALAPAAAAPTEPRSERGKADRSHTVVKGDTLYSLAQKYYGNRSKWHAILEANRDALPTASTPLKIGMELRIP